MTFFSPLFDGRSIIPKGNTNYSLLGITPSQCKTLKVTGNCTAFNAKSGVGVPSINKQLDKCSALIDPARTSCYEALDKNLTTNVVPWVPWMWAKVTRITSNNVTQYQLDQFRTLRRTHDRGQERSQRSNDQDPQGASGRPGASAQPSPTMALYILRRLLWAILVVNMVVFLTFLVFFKLPNGDPALRFVGKSPTAETLADPQAAAPRSAVLEGVLLLRQELHQG